MALVMVGLNQMDVAIKQFQIRDVTFHSSLSGHGHKPCPFFVRSLVVGRWSLARSREQADEKEKALTAETQREPRRRGEERFITEDTERAQRNGQARFLSLIADG